MRLIAKIFSAFLGILAVPLFTFAACNVAIGSTVFNRATYENVLEDEVIFDDALTDALPAIINAPDTGINFDSAELPVNIQEVVQALEPTVWEDVTVLLIPNGWLQQNVTLLVDVLFEIADNNIDVIEREVDFTELRSRFAGQEGEEAATLIITSAPPCAPDQRDALIEFFDDGIGTLPICNPPSEAVRQASVDVIQAFFVSQAESLRTDAVTVAELFDIERDDARAVSLSIQLNRQGLILTYLCPMALLALIVIMVVRSLKGFSRWIGAVTIAVGILNLVIVVLLQIVAFGIVSEAVAASSGAGGAFLARLGSAIASSAFGALSQSFLLQSGIYISIGFVALALAWYFGRDRDDEDSLVLVTEEGEIISTATQQRIGRIKPD